MSNPSPSRLMPTSQQRFFIPEVVGTLMLRLTAHELLAIFYMLPNKFGFKGAYILTADCLFAWLKL